MSLEDVNFIEVYQRGIKKLESRWRYIGQVINNLKADDAFQQHEDLIKLLDYMKKGTNRIKLGVKGTEPAIDYPMEVNTLINAREPKLQYNYNIQSGLFILGSAIAELQETIKELNEQYVQVAMDEEYYGYNNHWHLIDHLIEEVE